MAPLIPLDTWSLRETREPKRPKSKCFLISEGENTEYWYLESLSKNLAKRGLPELIELKPVERTERERHQSAPSKLAEHAHRIIEDADGEYGFDAETDRVVMLFDVDAYRGNEERYLEDLESFNEIAEVAVTNPSFELFLLLHVEDALEQIVIPNGDSILENAHVSKHRRYLEKLASDVLGMNVKSNPAVGGLAVRFEDAAIAERAVNQDPACAIGRLTSNVGLVIGSVAGI